MTKQIFVDAVLRQTADVSVAETQWSKIESAYSSADRHFHTLSHLEQMYNELSSLQNQVEDWDSLLFALFFHDYIYDVVQYMTDNDNEDNSAMEASQFLQSINYEQQKTDRVVRHILATKKHDQADDPDTNFLTDADLAVLGQSWEIYSAYMKHIRNEYSIYPDTIFNAGRVKVLKTFLHVERLFKSEYFRERYEIAARENVGRELEILSFS